MKLNMSIYRRVKAQFNLQMRLQTLIKREQAQLHSEMCAMNRDGHKMPRKKRMRAWEKIHDRDNALSWMGVSLARSSARETHLTLSMLRGRKYKECEKNARTTPCAHSMMWILQQEGFVNASKEQIKLWCKSWLTQDITWQEIMESEKNTFRRAKLTQDIQMLQRRLDRQKKEQEDKALWLQKAQEDTQALQKKIDALQCEMEAL